MKKIILLSLLALTSTAFAQNQKVGKISDENSSEIFYEMKPFVVDYNLIFYRGKVVREEFTFNNNKTAEIWGNKFTQNCVKNEVKNNKLLIFYPIIR